MRENQRDSLLDHIFSNEENMIENIKYLPSLGKSDHLILQFDLVTHVDRFTRPNKRDELQVLSTKYKYDIIIITEFLPKNRDKANVAELEFIINRHKLFHTDMNQENVRGTLIYKKNDTHFIELNLPRYH